MDVSSSTVVDLSIFNNLPPELLSLTFIATLPTVRTASDIQPLSAHSSPLNISQVSRLWRTIALRTPQLWTHIHFDMAKQAFSNDLDDVHQAAYAISVFVERSKDYPLFVNVDTFPASDNSFVGEFWQGTDRWEMFARTIVMPLLQSRHRWKVAKIGIFRQVWQYGYDSNCSGHDGYDVQWSLDNMLLVEDMCIISHRRFEWMDSLIYSRNDPFILDISKSTYLRRFALEDEYFNELKVTDEDENCVVGSLLPRFPHLQKLQLTIQHTEISVETVHQLLASSPSLQNVNLRLFVTDSDTENVDGPDPNTSTTHVHPHPHPHLGNIFLPHLQYLRLKADRPEQFVPSPPARSQSLALLLSCLTAPTLLYLELVAEDVSEVARSAAEMLLRSSVALGHENGLTKLVLAFDVLAVDNLSLILDAAPALEELGVGGLTGWVREGREVARRLVVRDGQGQALCPNLRKLVLEGIDVAGCAHSLVHVLVSRPSLKELVIVPRYKKGIRLTSGGIDAYLEECRELVVGNEEMRGLLVERGASVEVEIGQWEDEED